MEFQLNSAQGEVPESVSFYTPNQAQYQYNVTKALNLLHGIGFTGGGSPSTPLRFPNGTAMSVTIFTDSNKAWDPNVAMQVAGFLSNLGITTQTQTLTTQNLAGDYASNAFNIRGGLVIYSSGGPYYFQPWIDGQQGCNIMGTPGCYGWQATPAPDGQTHWEYPPSADVEYQSNLTSLNNTPLTNLTGEEHYLDNIEALNAQYLPVIMLSYPDEIFAYNTQHWTNWASYYFITGGQFNETLFTALQPVGSTTTPTSNSSSITTQSSLSSSTSTSSIQQSSSSSTLTSSTTGSGSGTLEIATAVIVVIIVVGGIAAYMLRRKPAASTSPNQSST